MEKPTETIVEEREELMVSPMGDSKPTLRTAHFLKPTWNSIKASNLKLHFPSSLTPTFVTDRMPLSVNFNGWGHPTAEWKSWVCHMESKHQSLWKRSGIYDAIKGSTCTIVRNNDLMIGIAEKWCPETNTFVFQWGEVSITLEDLIVLGGYPVAGSPVFAPLESKDMKEIEFELRKARTEIGKLSAQKENPSAWMKKFMYSGSDIEHAAFLSYWLARFVFQDSGEILKAWYFPIAIPLAKGERVALAPAVLASIYRDLSLLKSAIVAAAAEFENDINGDVFAVTLWSPLQLVQIWVWERFQEFQPKPNLIKNGDTRLGLWDKVKDMKVENVRQALDLAGETFRFRPYTTALDGWNFPQFYKEEEEWIDVGSSNEDLLSFAVCLRASELVGPDCGTEQYLPHRVAMQFGMDQDLPTQVARLNESPELAWINYVRPFGDAKLCIPSRLFESDVTVQYLEWWRKSVLSLNDRLKDAMNNLVRKKRSSRKRSKRVPLISTGKIEDDNNADVPPGFSYKCKVPKTEKPREDIKPTILEISKPCNMEKIGVDRSDPPNDFRHIAPREPQNLSNSISHDVAPRKVELLTTKPVDNLEHVNCETGISNRTWEETSDIKCGISSNAYAFEIPVMELEARIARLQKETAELKEKLMKRQAVSKHPASLTT